MRRWIVALLDPSPIEKGAKDRNNAHIQQPPLFDVNKATAPVVLPPTSALRPTRARSSRSASPSKTATPGRKIASPRKARTTRSTAKPESTNGTESKSESEVIKVVEAVQETKVVEETEVIDEPTGSPSSHLQQAIEDDATPAESVASEAEPSVNGDHKQPETVHIEVQETVEREGEVETTTTNVRIDVPLDYPELPTPEDPAKMIAEAKRMVAEARELDGQAAGGAVSSKSSKRKAEDLSRDEDEVEELIEERPAKRIAYTTEQKLTKEKVTRRALVGLGFMAALGFVYPTSETKKTALTQHLATVSNTSHENTPSLFSLFFRCFWIIHFGFPRPLFPTTSLADTTLPTNPLHYPPNFKSFIFLTFFVSWKVLYHGAR